jgi:hypothetical protein
VDYFQAASTAPPGWERYSIDDVARLPSQYLAAVPVGEREAAARGNTDATQRLRRALFWPMVYELEPELWDAISQAEPIHPSILAKLEIDGRRVLEVAAGSGRLTVYLCPRASELICVEPSSGLRSLLVSRCRRTVLELERATAPGGVLALISPESPDWFQARGWERLSFDPTDVIIQPHDPELEAIFGPLDPPHELLWRQR